MILVAILTSLLIEKSFTQIEEFRQFNWFIRFERWLRASLGELGNGAFGVLLTVGLPVLVLALVYFLLDEAHDLLGFVFAVLVLLFSLGPRNLDAQVQSYIDAREAGDSDKAQLSATSILHGEIPGSAFQLSRAMVESILVQANERGLAVLFWFAVLGPVGAFLYRLASILKNATLNTRAESDFAQGAMRLHATLDWVPARLTALGYAVSGSFVDAIAAWRSTSQKWAGDWQASNIGTLLASGLGALKIDTEEGITDSDLASEISQVKATQALVWRTLVTWIVIITLMTLANWAS